MQGDWLYDPATLNVIGRNVNTQNKSYSVDHLEVRPTAEQLDQIAAAIDLRAPLDPALVLPTPDAQAIFT